MTDSTLEPQVANSQTDESGLAAGQVPPPIGSNGKSSPAGLANNNMSSEAAAALAAADLAGKRRRWPILLVGAALGAAGTWGAMTLTDDDGSGDISTEEDVVLGSASVVLGDLLEEVEWSGTLGYGDTVTVAGSGGTVTAAAALGETLERGDVIALIDNEPVVALFGATPMWRDLAEGSEGLDVLQIEANLAALGYDPDQTVDIDQTYTANTEAMVERWQEAIGAEVTGRIAQNSVAIVEGPSIVSTAPVVGAAASGVLATVTPRSATTDVVATADGVVGSLAPIGMAIEHGSVLLTVDDEPVVALVDLDPVAAVLVSGSFTFTELEQALADDGYDPNDEMTVDGVVTDVTAAAVERWQTATGLPVTGQAESVYYLLVPSGRQVESHLVSDGAAVVSGGPILTASTSRLLIETVVDVADADEFELG
ncbi:MAG: peptidoglycan-binding domain-containing protein, partial [Acidimicrobiales bacterium]